MTFAGAYIVGRNMFGSSRGEWGLEWKGWWGPKPPYHAPVFVRRPGGPRGMGGWRSRAAPANVFDGVGGLTFDIDRSVPPSTRCT